MFSDGTRRIVVIKDIQSNMIEEAILILKSDREPLKSKSVKEEKAGAGKSHNDYLLKEAEIIIDSYIRENKMREEIKSRPGLKKTRGSSRWNLNTWLSVSLVGSILLLLFLATKLF